jgi:L-seryl-tRNA(Ser) seleniumtransferase
MSERTGRAALPSMTALLKHAAQDGRFCDSPQAVVTAALRQAVDEARSVVAAASSRPAANGLVAIVERAAELLAASKRRRMDRVINATGIVLHTGLGRAPLPAAALSAIADAAAGYCNLEIDLDSGDRGRRGASVEALLRELTGCEAALVVNNNAAATLLVLAGSAAGREVVVSRGQLIEIGGSFRLPEVMSAGGARLREVGTTNKTRLDDYASAISRETALLMHVHTSNYRVVGFAEIPTTAELANLAHQNGLLLYDDLGSGAMIDVPAWRAAGEPAVVDSIRAGADVISFSGDKLLGGPQAGIILGRHDVIDRLRRHPLARALRVDKLTLAALQATLELYRDPERAAREIPTLAMLLAGAASLKKRAAALNKRLRSTCSGETFEAAEDRSYAGGGALPAWELPTFVVQWRPRSCSADEASAELRRAQPPVVARVRDDAVLFDVRTLTDADLEHVVSAVRHLVRK